jgi:shikimate 5-dehydrogenase
VYTPERTPLIEAASRAGLRVVSGLGMFERQAGAQFEAWTGQKPPAGLFGRVLRARGEGP